jgi:beta-carotene ketolase (CrtW type)
LSLLLNGGLILGWGLSLALALGGNTAAGPFWLLVVVVLLRTQLQTGLFIVAHDAMHGLLCPARDRWNDALGALALMLYAALPYRACRRQHHAHHNQPASALDPDFPRQCSDGALHWYSQFLARYLSAPQMLLLLASWALLVVVTMAGTQVAFTQASWRVLLFTTLPLLLSSLQLFVFGTYLPHRVQRDPERRTHPISLTLPPWLSLLACYHFGYHREHHDNPALNWYELPAARARNLSLALPERLR